MEGEGKAAEGLGSGGTCCLSCVLCFVYVVFALANQLVEIDLDKVQISKLCTTVNEKPPQKHPDIIRCASVE
jgi:hypothetical protein